MERQHAIEKYARIKLTELSQKERAEQLEIMTLEHWSDADEWNSLPESIQKEFEDGEEIQNPESEQYDAVLMIWLKYALQSKTNEFLCKKLNVENIIGEPIELESCPCCGYRTIGERGNYEICKVCWWEDDGQDNKDSNQAFSGPNYGISLCMARYNYQIYGLYDPNRVDLMEKKSDESEFEKGRFFKIIDNTLLIEAETDWKWKINVA